LPSGPTTEDRTGLVAGTYSVQITDVNGCVSTVTASVTQPTTPVSGTTVVTNVACFGGSNGAINLTPTGGTGPYTFNWLPSGPTTEDRTGLVAGTYSVQITDVNGCVGTVTAQVTQPTSPVSGTAVVTNVACFGGTNGSIDLTPGGGTPGYTYNWGSFITTQDRSAVNAGTYTVLITDANGCTTVVTSTVTEPSPLSFTAAAQTNVSCFGGSDGDFTVNPATGGTGPYTYDWAPGTPSGDGTTAVTGLTAGTWTVTAIDANGCSTYMNFTITQPPALILSTVSQTDVSCFGGNNGTITTSVTGGTPGYSFDWSPGSPSGDGTGSVSGLIAGTWSVVVNDARGCSLTSTFTITESTQITLSTSQNDVACHGGNDGDATVAATGGTGVFTYAWSTGGTAATETGLIAGNYFVLVTDANGCSTSAGVTISEPGALTLSTSQNDVACHGGNDGDATVAATGGTGVFTYAWNTGGTAATETGLLMGNYSVLVTDANGCSTSAAVTISEPAAIVLSTSQHNVSCNGGNDGDATIIAAGGTGGFTYAWSTGGTAATETGLIAGNYSVLVTDANGCSISAAVTIFEPGVLTLSTSQNDVACNGGNDGDATVTATGGTGVFTYAWSTGGTAATETGLLMGNYSVLVTDANGCSTSAAVTISEPAAIVLSTSQHNVSCNGGNDGDATISAAGGTGVFTYAWSTGGTAATETGLAAGNYFVLITDANGCSTSAAVTISEPDAITFSTSHSNVSCNAGNNGSATVSATGGTGTLTYAWSSGGTAATETGLTAGNYSVIITDSNACTVTITVTINEPSALAATVNNTVDPSVCGGTDGSIDIFITGGTMYYFTVWSNSATGEDLTNIGAGAYSAVITDANGCTTTVSATLNDPNAPAVTLSLPMDTACGSFPGTIVLSGETPAGGTWSGNTVTGNSFDPFNAGTGLHYISYSYTDNNGCTGSATDSLYVDLCMGTTEIVSATWRLYPNPTNGTVMITTNATQNSDVIVEVYSGDGKLIFIENNQQTPAITLDLTNEPVGTYFIRLTTNGETTMHRIVKM
jgi:hypothetical protein